MTCAIFIVSCAKHFAWLEYCLKSIAKYATGFSEVVLALPAQEPLGDVNEMIDRCHVPVLRLHLEAEWPDKGMLWHEWMIVKSDLLCPDADLVLHMDSDCVFTEPVTPADYMVGVKPVLMYAGYDWLCRQQENIRNWQIAVEKAIGGPVENEFMRRHPAVHCRDVYLMTRNAISDHTKQAADRYIYSCKNEFPQGFAEFPTLGEVAWRKFRDHYHWINQETEGFPASKLRQFWSHRQPNAEDLEAMKQLGLCQP